MSALLLLAALASAPSLPSRPVRIGLAGPEQDACGSQGHVVGLRRDGDNYLTVRAAPLTAARALDTLVADEGVTICDSADGGRWLGIVWDASGDVADCGVASSVPRARPYRGPCAAGWVRATFVTVDAG